MNAHAHTAGEANQFRTSPSERVVSVDALRGFDMFWIIGADSLVQGLGQLNPSRPVQFLAEQLEHVPWEGFHFYDLIFPLFVFLVGTSSVYSLSRLVEKRGLATAYRRVLTRSVLLYLLGLFYYGGMQRDGGPEMFRYVGVLQRIAFCYLAGSLLFLNLRWRGLLAVLVVLLLGYWALLAWVPAPGIETGSLAEGANLVNWVDQHYLPGFKWDGDWDPEGLLSNLPAVGTAILGIFAGMLLRSDRLRPMRKVLCLAAAGGACVAVGLVWGAEFPIIKKLWTSSYVLLSGGWSYLLLALFYLVIDVWKFDLWARPFVWIGMNAIAIYLLVDIVDFPSLIRRVLHEPVLEQIQPYGDLVVAVLSLALAVTVCWAMYRKQVFLRV